MLKLLLPLFLIIFSLFGCADNSDPIVLTEATKSPQLQTESTSESTDGSQPPTQETQQAVPISSRTFHFTPPDAPEAVTSPQIVAAGEEDTYRYVQYCFPKRYSTSKEQDNVIYPCTDEMEMNQGSHYAAYAIENDDIRLLDTKYVCRDYQLFGQNYHIEFEYARYNGSYLFTYAPANNTLLEISSYYRIVHDFRDGNVLIALRDQTETQARHHLYVYNFETEEMTDFLKDLDAQSYEELTATNCIFTDYVFKDATHLLLLTRDSSSDLRNLFYVDLDKKIVKNITAIIETEEFHDAFFIGDDILCYHDKWSISKVSTDSFTLVDSITTSRKCYIRTPFVVYREGDVVYMHDFLNGEEMILDWPDDLELKKTYNYYASKDGRQMICTRSHEDSTENIIFDCDSLEFIHCFNDNPDVGVSLTYTEEGLLAKCYYGKTGFALCWLDPEYDS